MSGLYGPGQNDWYLDEKGLMHADKLNQSQPKEPTTGFQLFATRTSADTTELVKNFDLVKASKASSSFLVERKPGQGSQVE